MTANVPEKTEPKTGTVAPKTDYEKFVQYLQDRAAVEGPLAIQALTEAQTARIFAAKTEEELEAAMEMIGLVGLRDLDNGAVIQFNEFHLMPGNREEFNSGIGVFAVIDATVLSDTKRFGKKGQNVTFDTSIPRIVTWLRAIESGNIRGMTFPITRQILKVPVAGGKEMITLARLPVAPVQATADK